MRSLLAFILLLLPVAALAQPEERLTAERQAQREAFSGIGVDEQFGETIPLDLTFTDHNGDTVQLGDYFGDGLPVVMTFVYHDCPMLCSLILDGTTTVMRDATVTLGQNYRVLAVSFDPRDTPAMAAEARALYGRRLGEDARLDDFVFLTGEQEAIDALTDAVGFRFEWVESQQDFAHTSVLTFLSPEAVVTRYLYGIAFDPGDFRLAAIEARQGEVSSPMEQLLLYCFIYDPDLGGYVLHATNAMKLGGLFTLILLLGGLGMFWLRERRRNADARRTGGWDDVLPGLRKEGLGTAPGA